MNWKIDSTHSHVSFVVRVMSISTTRGHFNAFHGKLHIDEQNPANSWVDVQVEATSIDTRNKLRDAHLRSAAFFDVKKYSTITFTSTHIEHVGGQDYQVMGNLTLHGVTRPITFDVHYRGQSSMMDQRTCLTALATINRFDFGVGQGVLVRFAASSMVTIEIDLEAVQCRSLGEASDLGCWLLTAEYRGIARGKLVETGRTPPENRLDDR